MTISAVALPEIQFMVYKYAVVPVFSLHKIIIDQTFPIYK